MNYWEELTDSKRDVGPHGQHVPEDNRVSLRRRLPGHLAGRLLSAHLVTGASYRRVAEVVGIDVAHYWRITRGERCPSPEVAEQIIDVLELNARCRKPYGMLPAEHNDAARDRDEEPGRGPDGPATNRKETDMTSTYRPPEGELTLNEAGTSPPFAEPRFGMLMVKDEGRQRYVGAIAVENLRRHAQSSRTSATPIWHDEVGFADLGHLTTDWRATDE